MWSVAVAKAQELLEQAVHGEQKETWTSCKKGSRHLQSCGCLLLLFGMYNARYLAQYACRSMTAPHYIDGTEQYGGDATHS